MDALLDQVPGLTLREACRLVEASGHSFPYRTAQDWKLRDELPRSQRARELWEKFVAVCSPPEGAEMDRNNLKVVSGAPNANLSAIEHYVVRLNEIESMVRDLRDELVVLARDIAKRKRG